MIMSTKLHPNPEALIVELGGRHIWGYAPMTNQIICKPCNYAARANRKTLLVQHAKAAGHRRLTRDIPSIPCPDSPNMDIEEQGEEASCKESELCGASNIKPGPVVDPAALIAELGGPQVWAYAPGTNKMVCKACNYHARANRKTLLVQHAKAARHRKRTLLMITRGDHGLVSPINDAMVKEKKKKPGIKVNPEALIHELGGPLIWAYAPMTNQVMCKLCDYSARANRKTLLVGHARTTRHREKTDDIPRLSFHSKERRISSSSQSNQVCENDLTSQSSSSSDTDDDDYEDKLSHGESEGKRKHKSSSRNSDIRPLNSGGRTSNLNLDNGPRRIVNCGQLDFEIDLAEALLSAGVDPGVALRSPVMKRFVRKYCGMRTSAEDEANLRNGDKETWTKRETRLPLGPAARFEWTVAHLCPRIRGGGMGLSTSFLACHSPELRLDLTLTSDRISLRRTPSPSSPSSSPVSPPSENGGDVVGLMVRCHFEDAAGPIAGSGVAPRLVRFAKDSVSSFGYRLDTERQQSFRFFKDGGIRLVLEYSLVKEGDGNTCDKDNDVND